MIHAGTADIMTVSGKFFNFLEPTLDSIDINDIAHALSMTCRFSGHCNKFYSVAEHCVRVSWLLTPEYALWGLLHDASEAYLTDIPRPIKRFLPGYKDLEMVVLNKIAEKYGLSWPEPNCVKDADDIMLATEARDLFQGDHWKTWGLTHTPIDYQLYPYNQKEAKELFLEEFGHLYDEM